MNAAGREQQHRPMPTWNGPDYFRVVPGVYTAFATRVRGPEWVRSYQRWAVLVEFELLAEADDVRVCMFLNLGRDARQPTVGRRSRYFAAWTAANGGPPTRGQAMDPSVFLDGQMYRVEVGDIAKDSEDEEKPESAVYSKVARILSAEKLPQSLTHSVTSQESRVAQADRQPIKLGSGTARGARSRS